MLTHGYNARYTALFVHWNEYNAYRSFVDSPLSVKCYVYTLFTVDPVVTMIHCWFHMFVRDLIKQAAPIMTSAHNLCTPNRSIPKWAARIANRRPRARNQSPRPVGPRERPARCCITTAWAIRAEPWCWPRRRSISRWKWNGSTFSMERPNPIRSWR